MKKTWLFVSLIKIGNFPALYYINNQFSFLPGSAIRSLLLFCSFRRMEFPGQKHLFSWMLFDFGHNYVNRNNDAIAEELCRCYTGSGGVIDASSTSAPAFCPAYGLAGTFFIGKNDTAFKLDVGFGTFNLLAVKTGFSMFNIFIRFFTEIALETDWAAFY